MKKYTIKQLKARAHNLVKSGRYKSHAGDARLVKHSMYKTGDRVAVIGGSGFKPVIHVKTLRREDGPTYLTMNEKGQVRKTSYVVHC